jgi:hypothetical protein
MTTRSEEYKAAEAKREAVGVLVELYGLVHRKLMDGRPVEAVEACEEIVKLSEELGEDFTTTQFPPCEMCAGTAEIPSPSESDRKVRCQDQPYRRGKSGECQGNRYGRMHPTQLRDYVQACAAPKTPVVEPGPPLVPDETVGELKPTPPPGTVTIERVPPYVYDRDAVIAFNNVREAEQPMIPLPEDDEEVLAHADGTFTVRKKGGGQ